MGMGVRCVCVSLLLISDITEFDMFLQITFIFDWRQNQCLGTIEKLGKEMDLVTLTFLVSYGDAETMWASHIDFTSHSTLW